VFEQTINTSNKPKEYLDFGSPEEYLEVRKGKFVFGLFRRWFELRAIDKCLKDLPDIHGVCDIPCGPGTLFPYWHKKGYKVVGADASDRMTEAAGNVFKRLNLEGRIMKCNAFTLKNSLKEDEVDLIASVRFFYYFKRDERIELLKTMGEVSRKYLLVQYKTMETKKGKQRFKEVSSSNHPSPIQLCSSEEILEELRLASLDCIKIVPISQASERVFVGAANRK
jgi:cyclopropane fatty-acyl-phospholipid synthase-like methyltransferase